MTAETFSLQTLASGAFVESAEVPVGVDVTPRVSFDVAAFGASPSLPESRL